MKKVMVIVNPTAGSTKGPKYIEKIQKKFSTFFDEIDIRITKKSKDASEFSGQACDLGYHSIFALGGDGTVNEVISGMALKEYRPKFGILPGGTVNMLARMLNIPMRVDWAIKRLDFNRYTPLDIGKANDKYFAYIFSIGVVAEAIHNVGIDEKTRYGPMAYAFSTIKNIRDDKVKQVSIETEKDKYYGPASHVLILLRDTFGHMRLVEDEDEYGYANILILKNSDFLTKMRLIPSVMEGAVEKNKDVVFLKASNIKICSTEDIETDLDGDKGDNLPVEIEVLKKHIEVYY